MILLLIWWKESVLVEMTAQRTVEKTALRMVVEKVSLKVKWTAVTTEYSMDSLKVALME